MILTDYLDNYFLNISKSPPQVTSHRAWFAWDFPGCIT